MDEETRRRFVEMDRQKVYIEQRLKKLEETVKRDQKDQWKAIGDVMDKLGIEREE